jgi:hypothetical protein
MTRFVMLTDEPERLRRAYGGFPGWTVTEFSSAVDALVWERRMRSDGAFVLDSRGWRWGVSFTREAHRDGWVARPRALAS